MLDSELAPDSRGVVRRLELKIGDAWRASGDGRTRPVINPATQEVEAELPVATLDDLREAAASSAAAFAGWRRTSALERGAVLRAAATQLRSDDARIAALITRENGKTLAEARAEVHWACDYLEWYAEEGRRTYGRVIPAKAPGVRQLVVREPVGPVLALSTWNWPLVTAARKIAPALAAGCTVILKPPEETPSGPIELVKALEANGLPAGVVNLVCGDPAQISATLIAAPEIRRISFTGSVPVGRQLALLGAQHIKPLTLELGGHAPVLIFEDADIEAAIRKLIPIKFRTAGQVCSSPTRYLVHESVAGVFAERFSEAAAKLKVGDGLDPDVDMGPLINERRLNAMAAMVEDAVAGGARVLTGGSRIGGRGWFFAPTVMTGLSDDALILREEPFGPLVPIQTFGTYEEAVAKANHLSLGLCAYVFTRSLKTAQRLGEDLECGMIGVNTLVVSLAEGPFGGVKDSGYGKEGGVEGIEEFMTTKFIAEAVD